MTKKVRRLALRAARAATAMWAGFAAVTTAGAQGVPDFYANKPVEIYVGSSVGGG